MMPATMLAARLTSLASVQAPFRAAQTGATGPLLLRRGLQPQRDAALMSPAYPAPFAPNRLFGFSFKANDAPQEPLDELALLARQRR